MEVEPPPKKRLVLGEKWWRKIVHKEVGHEKNPEEEEKEKEENDDDECYVVGEDEYNPVVFDIMEANTGMLFVCIARLNGHSNEEFVILNVYEWEQFTAALPQIGYNIENNDIFDKMALWKLTEESEYEKIEEWEKVMVMISAMKNGEEGRLFIKTMLRSVSITIRQLSEMVNKSIEQKILMRLKEKKIEINGCLLDWVVREQPMLKLSCSPRLMLDVVKYTGDFYIVLSERSGTKKNGVPIFNHHRRFVVLATTMFAHLINVFKNEKDKLVAKRPPNDDGALLPTNHWLFANGLEVKTKGDGTFSIINNDHSPENEVGNLNGKELEFLTTMGWEKVTEFVENEMLIRGETIEFQSLYRIFLKSDYSCSTFHIGGGMVVDVVKNSDDKKKWFVVVSDAPHSVEKKKKGWLVLALDQLSDLINMIPKFKKNASSLKEAVLITPMQIQPMR